MNIVRDEEDKINIEIDVRFLCEKKFDISHEECEEMVMGVNILNKEIKEPIKEIKESIKQYTHEEINHFIRFNCRTFNFAHVLKHIQDSWSLYQCEYALSMIKHHPMKRNNLERGIKKRIKYRMSILKQKIN